MHLRTQLRILQERGKKRTGYASQSFLSIATLRQLATSTAVRRCLQVRGITLDDTIVSQIVDNAPKLLSVLVLLEREYHIGE